jgi:hypothetical protein
MNISFLFGAGISLPSKKDLSTQAITDIIISGKNIMSNNGQDFQFCPDDFNRDNDFFKMFVKEIVEFIKIIVDEIKNYQKEFAKESYNYEDIYYLIEEMHREVAGEKDSLTAYKFIKSINPQINELSIKCNLDLLNFLATTISYFKCIVKSILSLNIPKITGLDFLKDLNNDCIIGNINIFTLNHDLLLEQYFNENSIKINDGFSEPIKNDKYGDRYWKPESYNSKKLKIKLFKIHGSIDWHRIGSNWYDEKIYISNGNPQYLRDSYPKILIGTFNKLEEYTSGIFIDLICLFNKQLNSINNLIISGYSFGDKGINSRITDWAYKSRNKRIIIIDPNMDGLKDKARGSISNKWDGWIKEGKLKTIEKGIENVTWDEIKSYLVSD